MEKKIKYRAYVVERHPKMFGEKAGWKVGFQPEACEEMTAHRGLETEGAPVVGPPSPVSFIQMGGQFIETTDREFFKQGIRYEVEVTITRKA